MRRAALKALEIRRLGRVLRGAAVLGVAALPGSALVAPADLPQVLSLADAGRYARIFAHQGRGALGAADPLIARLEDRRLMGHVLAQRYLEAPGGRPGYGALRAWLVRYADHPDADRIHRRARRIRPQGATPPPRPARRAVEPPPARPRAAPHRSTRKLTRAQRRRARKLKARVRRDLDRLWITRTEKLLARPATRRLLDDFELDEAYVRVAAARFHRGDTVRAFEVASAAADRWGGRMPAALWTAGLAAWRLGQVGDAARHFEDLADAPAASPTTATAAAFWAARALERLGERQRAKRRLAWAARHPHSFYGLLALRTFGADPIFDFTPRALDRPSTLALLRTAAGTRALALIQAGQPARAERELLAAAWRQPGMAEALMALAERAGLPALTFRLGRRLANGTASEPAGTRLAASLYPVPPWRPDDGFTVDRALIYAFMRQESQFKSYAWSHAGARGLMQLMPGTANFISGQRRYRGRRRRELFQPELNVGLGQRYITHLISHPVIRGDLLRLVVAYNGGPGNLNSWLRRMDHGDDPLLFVESLPLTESRRFVKRVLANLWIYRLRLGQPAPSLGALAAGRWPRYRALDRAGS